MARDSDKAIVYRDRAGQFRWRRVASNGEILSVSSESYITLDRARDTALSLNPGIPVVFKEEE